MDAQTKTTIDASRERLRRFVETSSDDALSQHIEDDWTVSALLAHTAFWDRRAAWLVKKCIEGSYEPSPASLDEVNDSALLQWRLVPPRAAAQEALDAAEAIDGLLAGLSAEQLALLDQHEIRYDRSRHRNEHLDQIERALGKA